MADNDKQNSRKTLKFAISQELYDVFTMIESVRQKKQIYEDMVNYFIKYTNKHYKKKSGAEIAKLLEGKFGNSDIIIYLTEEQANVIEMFAEEKNLDIKDLTYNMVVMFLRETQKQISPDTIKDWKRLTEIKADIEAAYSKVI